MTGPLTFTVNKGVPLVAAGLEEEPTVLLPNMNTIDYPAGSSVVAHVVLQALNSFLPPTGNVTVNFGTLTQSGPATVQKYSNQGLSTADLTFANVPAGTYTLSAAYAGDAN
jgi:hypothetical protein